MSTCALQALAARDAALEKKESVVAGLQEALAQREAELAAAAAQVAALQEQVGAGAGGVCGAPCCLQTERVQAEHAYAQSLPAPPPAPLLAQASAAEAQRRELADGTEAVAQASLAAMQVGGRACRLQCSSCCAGRSCPSPVLFPHPPLPRSAPRLPRRRRRS